MIRISNEGVFDGQNNERIPDTELPQRLADNVIFSDDLKFFSFFNLLLVNHEFIDKAFYTSLGGYKLLDFAKDYNSLSEKKSDFTLRVSWTSELYEDGDLILSPMFDGYNLNNNGDKTLLSIEFTPLNIMRLSDFKLDCSVNILDFTESVNKKESVYKLNAHKDFTLFEIIHAVLDEISYFGTPEERNETLEYLNKKFDDVSTDLDKQKLYPFDIAIKLEKDLSIKESELQDAILNEEYEKAGELKTDIDNLKKLLTDARN